jgi:hypothetical protein
MRQVLLTSAALALALLLVTSSAHAGGLEYAGQGPEALGRGGATTARADTPMVLAENPAGLAELRGTQLLLAANVALLDACVDPIGYYGWGAYLGGKPSVLRDRATGEERVLHLADNMAAQESYYTDKLDTVCLNENVVPVPQIIWTMRLSERLGIGAGLVFPSVMPSGSWGGRNGIIHGDTGELRPAFTRYQLLRSNNIGIFPNIGFGYRLFRQLRVGAAFEYGMIGVDNFTMSTAGGGTTPKNDLVAHVKTQDWFVPAFTLSVHAVPIDALDIVLAFRWQDDLKSDGNIDITSGIFDPASQVHTTGGLPIHSLVQHFPWKARAGIRYADRIAPRPDGTGKDEADWSNNEVIHDAFQDERWDIELDVEFQKNSVNDKQVLKYNNPPDKLEFVALDGTVALNDGPTETIIEKHWKDQLSVRVGGQVNVVPGLFGVMAGAHYETRGVDPAYVQADVWPMSRVGLHGGIIIRVHKSIDLIASFAHVFQETITAVPPQHQARDVIAGCFAGTAADPAACAAPPGQIGAIDKSVGVSGADRKPPMVLEEAPHGKGDATARLRQQLTISAANQPPYVINSGTYRSNFDVIAAGVNVHF